MLVQGFVVRTTEAAAAFVRRADADVVGIRPLWVPESKQSAYRELDEKTQVIQIREGDNIRECNGIPCEMEICDIFAAKVKLAA